jgi:hypothetical protein
MKTMNIKAHFEKQKKNNEELAAKARGELENVNNEIALNAEENSKLGGEKRKLENLLEQNEKAGLGGTELKEKILALDSKLANITRNQGALQEKAKKCFAATRRSFEREDLMVSVLENEYRCSEANIVDNLDACFMALPVKVTQSDDQGRPLHCDIQLASRHSKALRIKPGTKHFWIHFHPESLEWLRAFNESEDGKQTPEQGSREMRVFFDSKSKRVILPIPLQWHSTAKDHLPQWHERETETTSYHKDRFDDVAICLESRLDALIQSAGGELNLDDTYSDNAVMAYLRDGVVSQTNPEPKFKKSDGHLSSGEICNRIQSDWERFVKCPWSNTITGTLALCKYLVENGEKVRFWSGEYENNYGLRVRTRDHDWIVGDIFIESSETEAPSSTPMTVHDIEEEYATARLGRLFLYVRREAEGRNH